MVIPTQTILKELMKIPAVQKMKASAQHSLLYGALVGTVTAVSGIIGGAYGLAAGGIVSSTMAAVLSNGKLKSVPYIILYETTEEEKEKLAKIIRDSLTTQNITTAQEYIRRLKNDPKVIAILIQLLYMFVSSDLHQPLNVSYS